MSKITQLNYFEIIGIAYLIIINIIGFGSMGIDKARAKKNAWRIKEKTLFIIALIGGSLGSNIGMYTFRHKTKHWYFVVFMPLILIAQIAAGIVLKIV
ncbi:MAG: DUF1294 domain-containing protein [Christensenellaceae bacterium]|nr:DUF1294 domain-containing protein [Christensenellaceae bacterium]